MNLIGNPVNVLPTPVNNLGRVRLVAGVRVLPVSMKDKTGSEPTDKIMAPHPDKWSNTPQGACIEGVPHVISRICREL